MIETLLNKMTLEEQVSILAGANFWATVGIERLNIPSVKVTDGPNGARGGGSLVGGVKSACFPSAISVGASWNVELAKKMGIAIAEEAKTKTSSVLLAPTVNIHRSGLNGRNFECYSEDPTLTSDLAVAYIEGVQSQGVAATIKHYVGNESEIERQTISSEISERALREIYLPPFEAAVKKAKVMAVMTAYNKINSLYASEHKWLLNQVLRQEWQFDGIVMSDWFGSHTTVESVNAGLDLEMPGPTRDRGDKLVQAVKDGKVDADTIRQSAKRILELLEKVGAFENAIPTRDEEQAIDNPEHRALIRELGIEGSVLLKNDGTLPLDKTKITSMAAIGPNAAEARIMGGGSAQINAHYKISPIDGLKNALNTDQKVIHAQGCSNNRLLKLFETDLNIDFFAETKFDGSVIHNDKSVAGEYFWAGLPFDPQYHHNFSAIISGEFTPDQDGEYDFGIANAGLAKLYIDDQLLVNAEDDWTNGDNFFGLGCDEVRARKQLEAGNTYKISVKFRTSPEQAQGIHFSALRIGIERPMGESDLQAAVKLASEQPLAILCVGRQGEWDTEGLDQPNMRLPGTQEELIQRVAAVNSNTIVVLQTGGPIEMPWLDDVSAVLQMWYPGQELGNSMADMLLGIASPVGYLPQTFPQKLSDNSAITSNILTYPGDGKKVSYDEGVFIGYRHHVSKNIATEFPFGYGLTYSKFTWNEPKLSSFVLSEKNISVTLDVTNIGQFPAAELVQLYMQPPVKNTIRPTIELCDFAKIHLKSGETGAVELEVCLRDLSYFDETAGQFIIDAGKYKLLLAHNAESIQTTITINVEQEYKLEV